MSAEKPDYNDADLVLRVYEMRREAKTREARDLLNFQFWPKSFDDIKEVQKHDNPMNFAWRQLSTYWELVFGMARNGIVNADYLTETNAEGLFHFAKVAPFLEQIRKENPMAFRNAEWATTGSETGKRVFGYMQEAIKKYSEG